MKAIWFRQMKFVLIFLFGISGLLFSLLSGQQTNIAGTILNFALLFAIYTVVMLFIEIIALGLLKFYYHNRLNRIGARVIRSGADSIEIIFAILMILYAHDTSLNLP